MGLIKDVLKFTGFMSGLFAGIVASAFIYDYFTTPRPKKHDQTGLQFAREVIPQIMQEQENKLGIHYEAKPRVVSGEMMFLRSGEYNRLLNQVILNKNDFGTDYYIEESLLEMLHHELLHCYIDQLLERSKIEWLASDPPKTEDYCKLLVSEGIAEYARRVHKSEMDFKFPENPWPKTEEEWSEVLNPKKPVDFLYRHAVIYRGGYILVKPIIDKYGSKGIDYLILNPPEDVFDLKNYQQEVIERLSE